MLDQNDEKVEDEFTKRPSNARRNCAQVIATVAFGLLVFSVSNILFMPTVVLGSLYNENNGNNSDSETNESFTFSKEQASWFGSIAYVAQPLGSIASGFMQDVFGRRRCMMLVTFPQMAGWAIIYFSEGVTSLFVAAIMMGLSVGFMEAPAMSYLGETCEPRLRGTLSSFSEVFYIVGVFFSFFTAAVLPWRLACILSIIIPIAAFVSIYIIPESPTWYFLKNKPHKAEESLQWLRGWVKKEEIQQELEELNNSINQGYILVNQGEQPKKPNQITLMTEGRVYRPIILVTVYFFIGHCIALVGLRPILVNIFRDLNTTMSPYSILVLSGLMQCLGGFFCIILIHKVGKRVLMIVSTTGGILSCFLLAGYIMSKENITWIPVSLFCVNFFSGGLGIITIPWILISEIFPLDAKGFSSGLVAAFCYVFLFIITKSYINIASVVNLEGALIVYGVIGVLGLIFLYFKQPETEGKTLAEIQLYFQD